MKLRISDKQVNMTDLIFSISEALDITHHSLALHQLRTAYICWRMAEEAGFSSAQTEKLFLAATLHDIGALTTSEKLGHYEFEGIDWEPHCLRGELLYNKVPWLADSARVVRLHHTPWNRHNDSIEVPDVMKSQILMLAETLEREIDRDVYILHQFDSLREKIRNEAGGNIHLTVVDLFLQASNNEIFWLELTSPNLLQFLKRYGPARHIYGDTNDALLMEEFFTTIIDFRSKYTASHTAGVCSCTNSLGELLGLPKLERTTLHVAATLHDIGKIAISNEILEKSGKLTKQEFDIIKMHSYLTFTLLDSIGGLEEVASIAGSHHEKLDGGGYPFRVEGNEISTSSRILAVADVFTALAERRPYREAQPPKEIKRIMEEMAAEQHLDSHIIDTLMGSIDGVVRDMKAKQAQWADHYHDVLSLAKPAWGKL